MGPLRGGLLDPGFASGLAAHAGRVARRYPFLRAWTPVNEPLTTARFACLYGAWHPHLNDEGAFLRALANQCHAALLAMRAIRAAATAPWFVHTEDIGRTFSTEPLRDQADHMNSRRWLSLDLLCGRLDRSHPWRARLEQAGIGARVLDELATGEGAPDVVGLNHYVTSDRFLDHRPHLYPAYLHRGTGDIDTEATRVMLPDGVTGWLPRMQEVWSRYGLPIAVTEAHLGCVDAAEQLRWLMEAWNAARTLRARGVDIRAVTAWALFGLVDWDCMMRERRDHYESGVFDAAQHPPCPTPLAAAVRALAETGTFDHPSLAQPGWWRRADRADAMLMPA